ncbi:GSCOCG00012430001-RA-CDS, partial [Cotesia congregata]
NGGVNALLDTGSDLNLLCIKELRDEALCNSENTGIVGGIATSSMPITGSIDLKIFGVKITFHLVPEPPGGYRAILGNEFFFENRVTISFYWNTLVLKNRPIQPIPIINPRRFPEQKILALGTGPKLYILCNMLLGNYQRFLIDTGEDVCLINASALKPEAIIDIGKARKFRGLSDSTFETLGVVKLKILNIEVEFQVCREDLPFSGVGILGNNFLETEKAEISYDNQTLVLLSCPTKTTPFSLRTKPSSSYTLPPRMRMVVAVPVQDFEKSEGYLPRMNLPDGVLGGEAVVKVEDGYATCMVINLNSNSVDINIGP